MDKVHCNWCEVDSLVPMGSDMCPACEKEGYLMDIDPEGGE